MDLRIESDRLTLILQDDKVGVHTFQYQGHPLTKERPVFQVDITKLSKFVQFFK